MKYLDAPGVGGGIQMIQNILSDEFSICQNFAQTFCPQNCPQSCRGEQFCALWVICDVANCRQRISDSVIDDGIDSHGHRVFGEDFLGWNIERNGSEVANHDLVHAGNDEKETGTNGTSPLHATQSENHGSLVFLNAQMFQRLTLEEHSDWTKVSFIYRVTRKNATLIFVYNFFNNTWNVAEFGICKLEYMHDKFTKFQ